MQLKIFRVVGKTQTFFSCQEIHSVCSSYYRTTAPSTSLPILAVALLGSRVSAAARCCSVQLVCSRATKPHPTGTGFLAVRRAHDIQNPRACPHVSKGGPFVGTCTQCGRRGLTIKAMSEECENVRGLTQGEAVLEAMPGNTSCYPRAAHCCTKATYARTARNRCWRPGSHHRLGANAKACQRPALWLSRHDLVACPDIWHKLLRSRAELELCVFRARDFFATAELQIVHCCCQPSRSQPCHVPGRAGPETIPASIP
jgi:hypothetical protein